jgi:hypothetical protein
MHSNYNREQNDLFLSICLTNDTQCVILVGMLGK